MSDEPAGALSARAALLDGLGMHAEMAELRQSIRDWAAQADEEMQALLEWQLLGPSKYFRPATIFACHRAVSRRPVGPSLIRSATALELFHNVSLIIDDILDRSRFRRGKLTLHCRFGHLPALMCSGYIMADGFRLVADDPFAVRCLSELMKRLGVAECLQWRLRRHPLGIEDWRVIAGEDTGSMFEVCGCLGTRDERLRRFGGLLGILYHGCDDVGDVRGADALGGGGSEDMRDGILTLPAALAIRDARAAVEFRGGPEEGREVLERAIAASLPEAEEYLDRIAEEALEEARRAAHDPEPLEQLVRHTRSLSGL